MKRTVSWSHEISDEKEIHDSLLDLSEDDNIEYNERLKNEVKTLANMASISRNNSLEKLKVVLDLDQTLIYSSIDCLDSYDFTIPNRIGNGRGQIYVVKRPNLDEFLQFCQYKFETYIFSAGTEQYVNDIVDQIDRYRNIFKSVLAKNKCTLSNGRYVKNLNMLTTNLQRVVIIDDIRDSFVLQPYNGILIMPFTGDSSDDGLDRMMPILEELSKTTDVRTRIAELST